MWWRIHTSMNMMKPRTNDYFILLMAVTTATVVILIMGIPEILFTSPISNQDSKTIVSAITILYNFF